MSTHDREPSSSPRYLAPKARRGDGFGYMNHPLRPLEAQLEPDPPAVVEEIRQARRLIDEPECLTAAQHKTHIAGRANMTESQRLAALERERSRERMLLSQEERITKAHQQAQARHRDVSHEVHVLRQMQQGGKSVEKIERRLQGLERIAYLGRAA